MKQTKKASFVEAILNTIIGFGISVIAQIVILHAYGFQVSVLESVSMGVWFTFISIARSFVVRRLFEHLRVKGIMP